jgi:Putative transposase
VSRGNNRSPRERWRAQGLLLVGFQQRCELLRQGRAREAADIREHRWRNGLSSRTLELIEKLTLLIPPPRFHTLRFHGVLAA